MATETVKGKYVVGITLRNKEDYDKLMEKHSKPRGSGLFFMGLDFKGLFEGYPEENQYPCLVQYTVDLYNPFMFPLSGQLSKIVEDGYHVHIEREEG